MQVTRYRCSNKKLHQGGVSLVEVLVAVSVIATLLVTVALGVTQMVVSRATVVSNTVALYLAEEGYEMVRAIRDEDWSDIDTLTIGTTYYIDVTPTDLSLTTTPVVIDGQFTRSIVFDEVSRDSDDDIVPNGTPGATTDSNARQVIVTVIGAAAEQEFTGLVTNLHTP